MKTRDGHEITNGTILYGAWNNRVIIRGVAGVENGFHFVEWDATGDFKIPYGPKRCALNGGVFAELENLKTDMTNAARHKTDVRLARTKRSNAIAEKQKKCAHKNGARTIKTGGDRAEDRFAGGDNVTHFCADCGVYMSREDRIMTMQQESDADHFAEYGY